MRQVVEKVLEHLKRKHKGLEKTLKPAHVKAHLKVRLILTTLLLTTVPLTTYYSYLPRVSSTPPPGVSSTLHTYHSLPACALTCLPLTCKVFVNCLVENPAFDSQTKENMTLKQSAFGSKCTRHLVHHDPP